MEALLPSAVLIDTSHEQLQRKLARGGKFASDLQKEHSEDVATWNYFRALQRFVPDLWVPLLFEAAGLQPPTVHSHVSARCRFWVSGRPTDARLDWLRSNVGIHGVLPHASQTAPMEGASEVDKSKSKSRSVVAPR